MEKAPSGGYPDFGTGAFSKDMSYLNWYNLSVSQRVISNYFEQLIPCAIFMAISVINYPLLGLIGTCCIVIGRFFYSIGYAYVGPKGRYAGGFVG